MNGSICSDLNSSLVFRLIGQSDSKLVSPKDFPFYRTEIYNNFVEKVHGYFSGSSNATFFSSSINACYGS